MSNHNLSNGATAASPGLARRGFLPDADVAARVLAHVRDRTTDRGSELWHEPVEHYRSRERWTREVETVLRRWPVPFCPGAALPEPGSFVAREAAGTPLAVVRGRDGRVRAFRNACRHRGTPLAEGSGCARSFVCRYHGWTYRLDGSLHHVPHEHGFPGLDKDELGLVFVTQEPGAPGADSALEGLPTLVAPEQRLLASSQNEIAVNWKISLEGFIEGYHIRSTHPKTFYPYGYDNLNVVELCGANSRVTYPFRRIEKLADVAPAARRVDGLLTYVYHLFPSALVTVLSHHTNLVVLEPLAPDRTRLVTYSLTNRGADAEDAGAAQRDAQFVNATGAKEDADIVLAIQRSLASGANDVFTFGQFEAAIAHFHRTLDGVLAS